MAEKDIFTSRTYRQQLEKHIQEGPRARQSAQDAPYCLWVGTDGVHHLDQRRPMRRRVIAVLLHGYVRAAQDSPSYPRKHWGSIESMMTWGPVTKVRKA